MIWRNERFCQTKHWWDGSGSKCYEDLIPDALSYLHKQTTAIRIGIVIEMGLLRGLCLDHGYGAGVVSQARLQLERRRIDDLLDCEILRDADEVYWIPMVLWIPGWIWFPFLKISAHISTLRTV